MAMKKRMISLTDPQETWVLARSGELGITVSDLIRRILDDHRMAQGQKMAAERVAAVMRGDV